MATRATTMEQESLKSGWGADYLNKLNESEVIVGNPLARTRASDSLIVRQLSGELAETPFITKGNTVGIASPQAVETQIKRWQAPPLLDSRHDSNISSALMVCIVMAWAPIARHPGRTRRPALAARYKRSAVICSA